MSDIFNEVDEEVRREQLKKLWERYGNLIIAAAFLVVAGVAAWRGYEYWQARKAAEAIAGYENRFTAVENRLARIEGDLKLVTWMIGFNLAGTVGIIFTLLRH